MTIGTSSGKVYESEFDMVADGMGKDMPNYQSLNTPDNLIPAYPKLDYRIDIEPAGPTPIPESKDVMNDKDLQPSQNIEDRRPTNTQDLDEMDKLMRQLEEERKRQLPAKKGDKLKLSGESPDFIAGMQYAMDIGKQRRNISSDAPAGKPSEGGGGLSRKNFSGDEVKTIKELAAQGKTPAEIGQELGRTKNSVIGKMDREGIEIQSNRSFGGTTYELPKGQTPSLPRLKFMEGPEP